MAEVDNCQLKDYTVPYQDELQSSIVPPATQANTFELKSSHVQIVQHSQFSRNPTEDLNIHLSMFVQYAYTLKSSGSNPKAIRLCLFPFSLRDGARA